MILTGSEILQLIEDHGMVSDYVDLKKQIQPAGLDLTLNSVEQIQRNWEEIGQNKGSLECDGKKLPERKYVLSSENFFHLYGDTVYILRSNESFMMPRDVSANVYTRSTLARMGILFTSAMVDAGYVGNLEFVIRTNGPIRIESNARFAQIVFHRHSETWAYNGSYNKNKATSKPVQHTSRS